MINGTRGFGSARRSSPLPTPRCAFHDPTHNCERIDGGDTQHRRTVLYAHDVLAKYCRAHRPRNENTHTHTHTHTHTTSRSSHAAAVAHTPLIAAAAMTSAWLRHYHYTDSFPLSIARVTGAQLQRERITLRRRRNSVAVSTVIHTQMNGETVTSTSPSPWEPIDTMAMHISAGYIHHGDSPHHYIETQQFIRTTPFDNSLIPVK